MSGVNMKYNEKMSELLGILKSINYDEVINDLEIESLKHWIEVNSNNNDFKFQEIIKKLNKILVDNKITELEKVEIINIVEQYYNLGKVFDNTAELVGIVEGIISDNEINLMEVKKVKKWMSENTQLVGTCFYDRLNKALKTFFDDGVLDDTEKQQLHIQFLEIKF